MEIYHKAENFDASIPTVITIGTFDGVHIGHRKIIERLVKASKNSEMESTLLTFFPHPRMVLQQSSNLKLINTIAERTSILASTGLENLIIQPFTIDFSRLTAREYVKEFLLDKLNAKRIIIGYDHRFGRNRTANIEELKNFAKEFDFEVEEISKQDIDEVSVSSTKIRRSLVEGDIAKANQYLSSNFLLTGVVQKGKGLGKGFGYPTANIHIEEKYKLIPKNGVYVVKALIDGRIQNGLMNIGTNPTVGGENQSIEVHFLDFNQDLYNSTIQVEVIYYIRGEKKFNSIKDLIKAMKQDEAFARNHFNKKEL